MHVRYSGCLHVTVVTSARTCMQGVNAMLKREKIINPDTEQLSALYALSCCMVNGNCIIVLFCHSLANYMNE